MPGLPYSPATSASLCPWQAWSSLRAFALALSAPGMPAPRLLTTCSMLGLSTNVISPERPSLVPSSPLAAQQFSYKQCELVYLPVCVLFGCPPLRSGATSYSPSFPAHGKYSVHSIHLFIHPSTRLFTKCSVCARHCSRLQRCGEEQESQSRTPPGGGMAFHTSSLPHLWFLPGTRVLGGPRPSQELEPVECGVRMQCGGPRLPVSP